MEPTLENNFCYIMFKYNKFEVSYINYLGVTSVQEVDGIIYHTLNCVHRLAPLKHWLLNESMNRTKLLVPAHVVAYNIFMNSVDGFDQFRSTNSFMRRENRFPISLFTYVLNDSM